MEVFLWLTQDFAMHINMVSLVIGDLDLHNVPAIGHGFIHTTYKSRKLYYSLIRVLNIIYRNLHIVPVFLIGRLVVSYKVKFSLV